MQGQGPNAMVEHKRPDLRLSKEHCLTNRHAPKFRNDTEFSTILSVLLRFDAGPQAKPSCGQGRTRHEQIPDYTKHILGYLFRFLGRVVIMGSSCETLNRARESLS